MRLRAFEGCGASTGCRGAGLLRQQNNQVACVVEGARHAPRRSACAVRGPWMTRNFTARCRRSWATGAQIRGLRRSLRRRCGGRVVGAGCACGGRKFRGLLRGLRSRFHPLHEGFITLSCYTCGRVRAVRNVASYARRKSPQKICASAGEPPQQACSSRRSDLLLPPILRRLSSTHNPRARRPKMTARIPSRVQNIRRPQAAIPGERIHGAGADNECRPSMTGTSTTSMMKQPIARYFTSSAHEDAVQGRTRRRRWAG